MPRPIRRESTASTIHVFSRGNYKQPIFASAGTRLGFRQALTQCVRRCGWEAYAFAIMPNHFHLLLRTPRGNLSIGMQWLLSTFAMRFNQFREESGHVFQGRYRYVVAPSMQAAGHMFDYIHLNPIRKNLCTTETWEDSEDCSLHLLRRPRVRGPFRLDLGLGRFAQLADDDEGRLHYLQRLKRINAWDPDGTHAKIGMRDASILPTSWLVAPSPIEAGLTQAGIRELDENHRRQFLETALLCAGKTPADSISEAKGAPWKIQIALALHQNTTATATWIAQNLHMGSSGYVRKILSNIRGQTASD
jgi:REP element-mobilizing transposase RayT